MNANIILIVVIQVIVILIIKYFINNFRNTRTNNSKPPSTFEIKPEYSAVVYNFDIIEQYKSKSYYPYILNPNEDSQKRILFPKYYTNDKDDPDLFDDNNTVLVNSKIHKGRLENDFLFELYEYFDTNNIEGKNISEIISSPIVSGNLMLPAPFYLDIGYMERREKILIDIEIDEPYDLSTKKAIHYYTLDITGTIPTLFDFNEKRDTYFISHGWWVIRFSESQIKNESKECINLIRMLVDYIKKEKIEDSNNLPVKVKRWSLDDANRMSKSNSRN